MKDKKRAYTQRFLPSTCERLKSKRSQSAHAMSCGARMRQVEMEVFTFP